MVKIQVVNKNKDDDPKAIYIGRGSPLGNPYRISKGWTRVAAINAYKVWIQEKIKDEDDRVCDALNEIAEKSLHPGGVKLKCFCSPLPCHGEVIKKIICEAVGC